MPSVGEGARSKAPPKAMNRVWEPIELIPAAPGTLGVFPQAIHLPIITGLPRIPGVVHRSKFLCNQVWPGHPGVRSTAFRRMRPGRLLPDTVGKRKKTCSTRVNAVLQTAAAAPARATGAPTRICPARFCWGVAAGGPGRYNVTGRAEIRRLPPARGNVRDERF